MAEKDISYWLMKSEPDVYGINHLKKEKETLWDGIRNYQARNFMRSMKIGDQAFFYHSNCTPPCIVGMMEVTETNLIDPTQYDTNSKYYDAKSTKDKPRWDCVKLKYLGIFNNPLTLAELKVTYSEEELKVVQRGNRLSIMPVDKKIALLLITKLGDLHK